LPYEEEGRGGDDDGDEEEEDFERGVKSLIRLQIPTGGHAASSE
jgi:hypothetical protein